MATAMINAWNRLAIGLRATHPADVARDHRGGNATT
jgi:hypothetical protein